MTAAPNIVAPALDFPAAGIVDQDRVLDTVAVLFARRDSVYKTLPGCDVFDADRDARTFQGGMPVVAHPPCARWGRYWGGNPTQWPRLKLGDDGGCFEVALRCVRENGGVIEHPEASHAWSHFDLNKPPRSGGWVAADWQGGWTCCVEQGHYGHRSRKATWLYAVGMNLPELKWGKAPGDFVRLDEGFHSAAERARAIKTGACQRLSKNDRERTPLPFAHMLVELARLCIQNTALSAERSDC